MKKLLFVLFFLFIIPSGVIAAECDLTVGQGEAYQDISSALNSLGNAAGKNICVRNNKIYGVTTVEKGGTAGSPLVIKSHPQNSGRPEFKNTAAYTTDTRFSSTFQVKASHVTLDNLEVSLSPGSGLIVSGTAQNPTKNIKLSNILTHHTYNSGIKILNTENVEVDSCEIYLATLAGSRECNRDPVCDAVSNNVSEQLHVVDSRNVEIKNCVVRNGDSIRGGTIGLLRSSFVTLRNNEVFDSEGNMTHVDDSNDVLITNNLLYDTCNEDNRSHGMYKLDENDPRGRNITVTNNLIVGASGGINFAGCQHDPNCPLENIEVTNNTVISAMEGPALRFGIHSTAQNISVRNNIFHRKNASNTVPTLQNSLGNTVNFSGNIWAQHTNPTGSDTIVPGLSDVFVNGLNPDTCVNAPLDPDRYQVRAAYAGKGADIAIVGRYRGSDVPLPSPPAYPDSWDLNGDGKINIFDVVTMYDGIGSIYDIFQVKDILSNLFDF